MVFIYIYIYMYIYIYIYILHMYIDIDILHVNRRRLHGYLAQRVPSLSLASSFRMCLNCEVYEWMYNVKYNNDTIWHYGTILRYCFTKTQSKWLYIKQQVHLIPPPTNPTQKYTLECLNCEVFFPSPPGPFRACATAIRMAYIHIYIYIYTHMYHNHLYFAFIHISNLLNKAK